MFRFCAVLAAWLAFALSAFAEDGAELLRAPTPGWVEVLDLPEVDPEMLRYAEDGEYFLLTDEQVAWEGETKLSHLRLVIKVLNRAGLEHVGAIRRDFYPANETLTLTGLTIHRNGARIDVADKARVEFMRREEDLDDGLIDGMVTALVEVPGVQVGDIVDFGFLWTTKPLFPGQTYWGYFDHEYSVPVGLVRLVLNWPADRPFRTSPVRGGARLRDVTADGNRRIEFTRDAHRPIEVEPDLPPDRDPWSLIYYSGQTDWRDVSDAVRPHYEGAMPLPPEWKAEVEAIRKAYSTDTDRAFAALRLVQDRIRYVGVEIGHGGYFARPLAEVVANGYGDCKDKSVLLVALLRELGLEADVALTDLDWGPGLARMVPMMAAFDHMIVRAVADGDVLWMDGTGSLEGGGRTGAVQPDLGHALPVTGKAAGVMQDIPLDQDNIGLMKITENFRFNGHEVFLDVQTVATGGAADRMRWSWSTKALQEIEDHYLEFYAETYPGIESLAAPRLDDDRLVNRVELTETYRLSAEALADQDLTDAFPFRADGFDDGLPVPDQQARVLPYYFDWPVERTHRVRVENLPREVEPGSPASVTSRAFTYSYSPSVGSDGSLTLDWHFKPLARQIAPEDMADYVADRERMTETTWQSWNLTAETGLTRLWRKMQERAEAQAEEAVGAEAPAP